MGRIKFKLNNILILSLIIYPLFSISSIRQIASPIVDGFKANNLIVIIPMIVLIKLFVIKIRITNLKLMIYLLIIFIYMLILSLFNFNKQTAYSIMFIIFPMLISTEINEDDGKKFDLFLKILISISIVYSIFVIVLFFNYKYIAPILHLKQTADYVTRHSTMLGSSISTSYFLLLNIPIGVIGCRTFLKKWKKCSIISVFLSVFAIVLQQSRICFIALGVFLILYFFLYGKHIRLRYRISITIIILLFLMWVFNNESLSRLYTNYYSNLSYQTRNELIDIGLREFYRNPLFGSGLANYYKRLWKGSALILIGNEYSLIDPHNLYVYILVEQGIIGFIAYFGYLFYLIKKYILFLPKELKYGVYILLIGQFLVFFGGSQLMNEINYSIIFWSYISIFCSRGLYQKLLKENRLSKSI